MDTLVADLSPPSSPLPTPNRLEVPGTPLRLTPQYLTCVTTRPCFSSPLVLFPEGFPEEIVDFTPETSRPSRMKRKLQQLSCGEGAPFSFAARVKPKRIEEPTHKEEEFLYDGMIGKGSFGTVYKVVDRDSRLHAMKLIERHVHNTKEARNMLLRERHMHELLKDVTNVVQSHGFGFSDTSCFLLLELCEGGNLEDEIASRKQEQSHFEQMDLWKVLLDIATGLSQMHAANIVHGDIKPANIFVKSVAGTIMYKIGDLGNAKSIISGSKFDMEPGDAKYMARECLNSDGFDPKATDIFSLGASVLEAASLISLPANGQLYDALRSNGPDAVSLYSGIFNCTLQRMLHCIPERRPTCTDLLRTIRSAIENERQ